MDTRLKPYYVLAEFLGQALGPDYEILLHDLTEKGGKIAAIVNSHVSGRDKGAPLSNKALQFIHNRVYETEDFVAGYRGLSQSNRQLKSSTMFIKGDHGELIGMLCINFNAGKYERLADDLLQMCGSQTEPTGSDTSVETFVTSVPDAIRASILEVTGHVNLPPDRLTMEEKISIVEALYHAGVFYMKGSVSEVAAQIGSSEATVYRYLSKLKD